MAVEHSEEEYYNALNAYWHRVNESEGFDVEGIVGPTYMVMSGQLVSYDCQGSYPLREKVKYYRKLGLHRYNLIEGTNFEQHASIKFNMRLCGAFSFYITLTARERDTVTLARCKLFRSVLMNRSMVVWMSFVLLPGLKVRPLVCPHRWSYAVHGELPIWPSDVDIQRFYMVDQSELLSTHSIRLYLEFVLYLKEGSISENNVSNLEFVKVAIETDEENPLYSF